MTDPTPEEHARKVRDALFAGNKILAIKFYREPTGVGLKEAKDAVEKLEAELRVTSPGQFTKPPASGGCAVVALILLLLGVFMFCMR